MTAPRGERAGFRSMQDTDEIKTCTQALKTWKSGEALTSVDISGMPDDYENACQRLLFTAVEEQLEHEKDVEYWDGLRERELKTTEVFPQACKLSDDEGMTGAMFSCAMSAAVLFLKQGWSEGIALAPEKRRITVTKEGTVHAAAEEVSGDPGAFAGACLSENFND